MASNQFWIELTVGHVPSTTGVQAMKQLRSTVVHIAALICMAISIGVCGPIPSASAEVTGSVDDWLAALCDHVFDRQTRFTIAANTCEPRSGGYINFDQFKSESDMNSILNLSPSNYSAKTTLNGYPLAIWIPSSRDGSELAPLKQFGFVISPQWSTPSSQPQSTASNTLPGLVTGAIKGQPCSNYRTFIFGVGQDGTPMACVSDGTGNGTWVRSQPAVGPRVIGASCDPNFAAQASDGRPLICAAERGWVTGP